MYSIIIAPTSGDLESRVRSYLNDGFIPVGGVITVTHSFDYTPQYTQPHFQCGYDNPISFAQAVYKPATKTLT